MRGCEPNIQFYEFRQFRNQFFGHLCRWIPHDIQLRCGQFCSLFALIDYDHDAIIPGGMDGRSNDRVCMCRSRREHDWVLQLSRISFQSSSIANGIYESDWFLLNPLCRKWLLLILLRSQRAERLTLYRFSNASRLSFANVSMSGICRANEDVKW